MWLGTLLNTKRVVTLISPTKNLSKKKKRLVQQKVSLRLINLGFILFKMLEASYYQIKELRFNFNYKKKKSISLLI